MVLKFPNFGSVAGFIKNSSFPQNKGQTLMWHLKGSQQSGSIHGSCNCPSLSTPPIHGLSSHFCAFVFYIFFALSILSSHFHLGYLQVPQELYSNAISSMTFPRILWETHPCLPELSQHHRVSPVASASVI